MARKNNDDCNVCFHGESKVFGYHLVGIIISSYLWNNSACIPLVYYLLFIVSTPTELGARLLILMVGVFPMVSRTDL